MNDFIIDTLGANTTKEHGVPEENSFRKLLFGDFNECLKAKFSEKVVNTDEENIDMSTTILEKNARKILDGNIMEISISEQRIEARKALEKSLLHNPDFEKLHAIPPMEVSLKNIHKQRKLEREKTKGKKWYGLPATEMTEEVKHDLEVLQMRSVLDPKHFYKKNDLKVLPKYFQIGKVMDSPLDFYNNRLTKKERKKTIVDELLADVEFNKYNKKKYKEIISNKQKTHYKAWRQAKKLKKKKK